MTEAATISDIEARSATWQLDTEQTGPVDMIVPYAVIGDQPDKLLLTGLGERDVVGIAERLAEQGVTGLAVASLVYPAVQGRLSSAVVERSIVGGTEALVHDISGNGQAIQQAIGNSEGGNQLLAAAYKNPELYGQLVVVAPLLNGEALGSNPKRQAKTLRDRFKKIGMTLDGDGQGGEIGLVKELMGGLVYAAEHDAREVVSALDNKLKIYVGEDDVVVPPAESEAGAGEGRITRVPGMGHPTLLDETGCRQIALIMQGEYTAGIVR